MLCSYRYETEFIEKIADKVYKHIAPNPLHTGQNPIGLWPRMEEVMSLLDMKPYDETVRMLGVWGLPGVGKTELATALYNNIVNHFDAASFLSNVREKSNKINGLEENNWLKDAWVGRLRNLAMFDRLEEEIL